MPGLRLGILASGDTEAIADMKRDAAIWNINSFAEFYMQIAEKYRADHVRAMEKLRAERGRFQKELSGIGGIRVVPSQANFIMVELEGGVSSRALQRDLLIRHDILVKDLSGKMGGQDYLRLAIRGQEDDDALIAALRSELRP